MRRNQKICSFAQNYMRDFFPIIIICNLWKINNLFLTKFKIKFSTYWITNYYVVSSPNNGKYFKQQKRTTKELVFRYSSTITWKIGRRLVLLNRTKYIVFLLQRLNTKRYEELSDNGDCYNNFFKLYAQCGNIEKLQQLQASGKITKNQFTICSVGSTKCLDFIIQNGYILYRYYYCSFLEELNFDMVRHIIKNIDPKIFHSNWYRVFHYGFNEELENSIPIFDFLESEKIDYNKIEVLEFFRNKERYIPLLNYIENKYPLTS